MAIVSVVICMVNSLMTDAVKSKRESSIVIEVKHEDQVRHVDVAIFSEDLNVSIGVSGILELTKPLRIMKDGNGYGAPVTVVLKVVLESFIFAAEKAVRVPFTANVDTTS